MRCCIPFTCCGKEELTLPRKFSSTHIPVSLWTVKNPHCSTYCVLLAHRRQIKSYMDGKRMYQMEDASFSIFSCKQEKWIVGYLTREGWQIVLTKPSMASAWLECSTSLGEWWQFCCHLHHWTPGQHCCLSYCHPAPTWLLWTKMTAFHLLWGLQPLTQLPYYLEGDRSTQWLEKEYLGVLCLLDGKLGM